jgi:cardiolipin synthase
MTQKQKDLFSQLPPVAELKQRPGLRARIFRILRWSALVTFVLQVLTAAILMIVASIRDRHKVQASFPRMDLDEVEVGENRLQLYCYGRQLFDDMLAAIDSAKESVYIESYIWKDDEAGWEFKTHLAKKAAEGIPVYVIFDNLGNLVVPASFKKSFDPRIHLLPYQALHNIFQIIDVRRYALDHRKILVVDGQVSFIGGYNIGSLYADTWRDTHLRIVGPASKDLARSFVDFWNRFSTKRERIEFPYSRGFEPLMHLHGNDALRLTFPIRDMYIEAINRAEHAIFLSTAYFVPDHILLDSLKEAAQRGVEVSVLVPLHSNHTLVDWVSHGYFAECMEAGIRILGYQHAMLHAKTCTIDGKWSTVGTANIDRLSSLGNFEINVEIYSSEFAAVMCQLFERDTADVKPIDLEEWKRRPWYTKFGEQLLSSWRVVM